MLFVRVKCCGRPLGIWGALALLIGFLVFAILLFPTLFPHTLEFIKAGLFDHVILTPAAPGLIVGVPIAVKAIIGLLRRRLWGMQDGIAAFAVMITFFVGLAPQSLTLSLVGILLSLIGMWNLIPNRRWFDEIMKI